jgi:hypothetical protein
MSTPNSTLFIAPPTAPKAMPSCCGGVFFGVRIPRDIPVFDARLRDGDPSPPAPWGELYFSRGAFAMGLKTGYVSDRGVYTSFGCQDTRDEANAAQTQARLREAIAAFRREAREGTEMPVAIEVDNYAVTMIRTYRPEV